MKIRSLVSMTAALLVLLAGCTPAEESAERQFFAMDTVMSVKVSGPKGEEAVEAVCSEISRLDALFSRTDPDSDISRLNAAAGSGTWTTLSGETAEVLTMARAYAEETGGAFDVTIAPVMDAWGFGTAEETYRVPDGETLQTLLPLVDSQKLTMGEDGTSARLELAGMEADLGGIAKGYAADRAVSLLEEAGITSALLNLGTSTISLVGSKADGSPWRVAVRDPADESGTLCVLELSDCALSTSGGYERYFEEDGQVYHHILDPKTGAPAQSGLSSVTVVTEQGTDADVWSTALYVMGTGEALDFWRQEGGFECILCQEDGTVLVTEGLEGKLNTEESGDGYTFEIVRR